MSACAGGIAASATASVDAAGNVLLQTPYGSVWGEHFITMLPDCNNHKGTYSVTVTSYGISVSTAASRYAGASVNCSARW